MKVEIFSAPGCSHCDAAKRLLGDLNIVFAEHDISNAVILDEFCRRLPRVRSVPQTFFNDEHIGGYEDLNSRAETGGFPRL